MLALSQDEERALTLVFETELLANWAPCHGTSGLESSCSLLSGRCCCSWECDEAKDLGERRSSRTAEARISSWVKVDGSRGETWMG